MCNLAGYSGIKKANPLALKLLAVYGRERGSDGFGIWIGNELFKNGGYNNVGDSYNIMYGVRINNNKNAPNTVLMHNRSKSVGTVNADNAHPFQYNYIDGKNYVFAHNGTIKNIEALCSEYKIPYTVGSTDSYLLGKIIYEHGFEVLTKYEGFAAFSLYNVNTDTLYLWKGFSQCESVTPTEERPLNMYIRKNAIYYASESTLLVTALNIPDIIIESVPNNTLLEIKNGEIINRIEDYSRHNIKYKVPEYNNYPASKVYYNNNNNKSLYKIEPTPQNKRKGKIYCWQMKYWKNGHLMNGIFNIDSDGKATAVTRKEYDQLIDLTNIKFFYRGFMIKSEEIYNTLVKEDKPDTSHTVWQFSQYLHNETIYSRLVNNRYSSYVNGLVYENKDFVPLYSTFCYKNNYGFIDVTDVSSVLTNAEKINATQELINNFM